ncbi:cell division protein FtsB [Chitinimonas lacunae]|uniref:Cell division protein FtsB n=1 Tax=Chitinimonas lacunae TaxID=1963018 RepID=A0ABV8MJ90_9NEIS
MRLLSLLLATLIVLTQWPLWIGKGSWLKVWQIEAQVAQQKLQNEQLQARNAALDAEVKDLKNGTAAIEERARSELGMVRDDEVFFQLLDVGSRPASSLPVPAPVPVRPATPPAPPKAEAPADAESEAATAPAVPNPSPDH